MLSHMTARAQLPRQEQLSGSYFSTLRPKLCVLYDECGGSVIIFAAPGISFMTFSAACLILML